MLQVIEDWNFKTIQVHKKSSIVGTKTCEGVHSSLTYTWRTVFRARD